MIDLSPLIQAVVLEFNRDTRFFLCKNKLYKNTEDQICPSFTEEQVNNRLGLELCLIITRTQFSLKTVIF